MKAKFTFLLALISYIFLISHFSLSADTKTWLRSKYKVRKVLNGLQFIIDFNGIGLPLNLVHLDVQNQKGAKELLLKTIQGKKLTIIPEEAEGLTEMGMQQVYAFYKVGSKKTFVNELLIKKGFANYKEGKSEKYKKLLALLKKAGGNSESSSSKSSASSDSEYCSELYSSKYHKLSCRWAKKMNPQSRIIYETMVSAEKAKKKPCNSCLFERVGELRKLKAKQKKTSVSSKPKSQTKQKEKTSETKSKSKKAVGALFATKSSKYFYSPISKELAKFDSKDLIAYKNVKNAKAAGKKPDPRTLRIGNPVMPPPKGKECIGRALPYLRPCRRETEDPTGLCEPCLNGRMR